MTNKPLLYDIKRPPAAPFMDAARAAALILAALDGAPARVHNVPPAVDVSIYPDAAARCPLTPNPSRYSGGVYVRPAASTTAPPNRPARLDDLSHPNGLNGLSMPERLERLERPERLKVTRTNELNELNGLNDLKQAHRYSGGVFQAERVERLN